MIRARNEAFHSRCNPALHLLVVGIFLFFLSCGGGGNSSLSLPASSTITSVSVSPTSVSVSTGGTQQFAETVTGTGAFNTTVSWTVNGAPGGNPNDGTINTSGLYTAPSFAPSPNMVSISATSVADATKSGMAQATITGIAAGPISVSVSPPTAALEPGAQVNFTATVQGNGSFNQGVTWSANGIVGGNASVGSITTSGTYTAPSNIPTLTLVTVTATTVATPTVSGIASVPNQ
jgi:hypothetical protein